METKPWQIPYPMENWKMRYMVVWIQNHDKFIVLIWKTFDMKFGCKIRINSFHSVELSSPDINFIDQIFFRMRTIIHCVTKNIGIVFIYIYSDIVFIYIYIVIVFIYIYIVNVFIYIYIVMFLYIFIVTQSLYIFILS
jgi:hypothetical protein